AAQCPQVPTLASRWPGSWLAAGLATLASPSGYKMVFATVAAGCAATTGPSVTTIRPATAIVKPPAARQPPRRTSGIRATARAAPGGPLKGRGRPGPRPGAPRPGPLPGHGPVGQRQAKAHEPQNGQVAPADGERQRDDRRRGDQQGPPGGAPHARDPQRRPE